MAWYPGARRLELQPESSSQPAISPSQFIMHSIAAPWDEQRIYEYWRDSTNLESHFGLDFDGSLGQFLSTTTKADANYKANSRAVSIETASNLQHTDPWTEDQIAALIKLGVWLHHEHGIPLRICRTWDDPGYGYHRLHREWSTSGTACPGDARVRQFHDRVFPGIVAAATGITPEEDDVTPQDIEEIAKAVWNYGLPNYDATGHATGSSKQAFWWLVWQDVFQARTEAAIKAAVDSLSGLLAAQHPNLTAEQITAAVRQGVTDGLVRVQVDINAPASNA